MKVILRGNSKNSNWLSEITMRRTFSECRRPYPSIRWQNLQKNEALIPDLVCIRWIHQRSFFHHLCTSSRSEALKHLPAICQPALIIFNFCKCSCKPSGVDLHDDFWQSMQVLSFSFFCLFFKLKQSPGVEGSPCALASTAPDTVFEALEEAATLFAQQRQKVVV